MSITPSTTPSISRNVWILALLLAICCAGLVGYYLKTGHDVVTADTFALAAAAELHATSAAMSSADERTAVTEVTNTQLPVTTNDVAKLSAQLVDNDPQQRAAAMTALAQLPTAQALPLLQKALNNGTSENRQLALAAIEQLAIRQGDPDDQIRTVLRLAIYDGGDESVAQTARGVLDEIDGRAVRQTPSASK